MFSMRVYDFRYSKHYETGSDVESSQGSGGNFERPLRATSSVAALSLEKEWF